MLRSSNSATITGRTPIFSERLLMGADIRGCFRSWLVFQQLRLLAEFGAKLFLILGNYTLTLCQVIFCRRNANPIEVRVVFPYMVIFYDRKQCYSLERAIAEYMAVFGSGVIERSGRKLWTFRRRNR